MRNAFLILFLLGLTISSVAQETYGLSDTSTLTIDGTSSLHDWTVTANTLDGTVIQNGESLTAVDFSVAVADILSDRAAAMDKKMHEALKKEEHPKVTFNIGDANAVKGDNQELKGQLTIAGVENEVSIPVTITQKDGALHISGERKIALKDYNIEPPTAMFGTIVVGDEVTVKFDLVFTKS